MRTHSLERISPKGGPFIGRCIKCGKTDLPSSAVHEECSNPSSTTQEQDILNAIIGNQPSACPDDTEPSAEALTAAREIWNGFLGTRSADEPRIALALDRFRAAGVREGIERAARFVEENVTAPRVGKLPAAIRALSEPPMTADTAKDAERLNTESVIAKLRDLLDDAREEIARLTQERDTATRRVEALEAEVGKLGERAGAEKMRALDEAVIEAGAQAYCAHIGKNPALARQFPAGSTIVLNDALAAAYHAMQCAARDAATDGEGRYA